jgi:group I intron endonuclease
MRKGKICGIYMITSPTDRIYIGQSIDIKRRTNRYKRCDCGEQRFLHNSILKHGWSAHTLTIIEECNREDLNRLEKYYIEVYDSLNSSDGMNLREGGDCSKMSEESKLKMSKSRIGLLFGDKNPMYGKVWIYNNDETKAVDSDLVDKYLVDGWELGNGYTKNNKNRRGVNLSKETKQKISDNHAHHKPMLGKKHTKETKDKISKSNKGRVAHNKRPIINIKTGVVYPSKKEAAESIGMKIRTLKAKLLGQIKNDTDFRYYGD